MATISPSDLIVKFDAVTDQSTIFAVTTGGTLDAGETGISFNLQVVEKGINSAVHPLQPNIVGSEVVGSGTNQINTVTSQDLANLISQYFSDKGILNAAIDGTGGTGRNIRSMKLIVNVDSSA